MPNDYSLILLLEDGDRDERAHAERALLRLLAEVTDAIEAYADDHNSDRPTDVTVLLPRLRRALGR
tara:strand:+ start:303 stop:500 length:198 start_codon:yes stop_codon:yes gene_type:complete